MNQEPFILCDNLVKIHKIANLEVVALQGLDLVVYPGELMGIVGPSGSGKTTLMNILGGLDRPSAGRVWVDSQDLLKMTPVDLDHYRSAKVGFVWQQSSRNLIPYLNARENVEYPMTMLGVSFRQRRKRSTELLDMVGLTHRQKSHLGELSGGEQQRVAIAVALANRPRLLLADEPTGEVDSATAQMIYGTFRKINQEMGLTTLIVSHDPEIARQVNRVVGIRDGKTSTETLRQTRRVTQKNGEPSAESAQTAGSEAQPVETVEHEEVFIHVSVLDSAGRVQIPKDYLQQLNIKGRVRIELVEDGIMIRPAPDVDTEHAVDKLITQLEEARKTGWFSRTFSGLSGIFKRKS